jgi:hypothetical protein
MLVSAGARFGPFGNPMPGTLLVAKQRAQHPTRGRSSSDEVQEIELCQVRQHVGSPNACRSEYAGPKKTLEAFFVRNGMRYLRVLIMQDQRNGAPMSKRANVDIHHILSF